jgi:hypothetical protein
MRETLLEKIDKFCARTGTPPTTIGAVVLNNYAFVSNLRDGLDVRLSTYQKVMKWLENNQKGRTPVAAPRIGGKPNGGVDRGSRRPRKAPLGKRVQR